MGLTGDSWQPRRFKKAGSEITDIEIVDINGTGQVEILTSFKDEGVYSLNPRQLQRQNAIDITLSGLVGLERHSLDGASLRDTER